MAMQDMVRGKLEKMGWTVLADQPKVGVIEVLATAPSGETEHYLGPLNGVAAWANKVRDVSVDDAESLAAWDAEYASLTDDDVQEALSIVAPSLGPTNVQEDAKEASMSKSITVEAPVAIVESTTKKVAKEADVKKSIVVEAPVVVVESAKNVNEESEMEAPKKGLMGRLFAKFSAPVNHGEVTAAAQEIPGAVMVNSKTDEVSKVLREARDNGTIVAATYQDYKGRITTGRRFRIAGVTDSHVAAWDLAEFARASKKIRAAFPALSPVQVAAEAANEATRTLRQFRFAEVEVTDVKAAPINPVGSGVFVLVPNTEEAVSKTGNRFPFVASKATAERLLAEGGYDLLPEGK